MGDFFTTSGALKSTYFFLPLPSSCFVSATTAPFSLFYRRRCCVLSIFSQPPLPTSLSVSHEKGAKFSISGGGGLLQNPSNLVFPLSLSPSFRSRDQSIALEDFRKRKKKIEWAFPFSLGSGTNLMKKLGDQAALSDTFCRTTLCNPYAMN